MSRRDVPGTIYLVHLDPPYKHAKHYLGWAEGGREGLEHRLAEHEAGRGARLLAVAKAAGSSWRLVRTWPGETRARERQIKNTRHVPHYCPDCQPERSTSRRQATAAKEKSMEIKHDGKTVVEVTTDRAKGAPESKQVEVSSPLGGLQYQPKSGGKADPDIEFEMGG